VAAANRAWLWRWLASLLLGIGIGLLSYLVARAGTTAYLLYQQQQFFQETVNLLRTNNSIESLANSNLREARMLVEALNARYHRLSLQIGFAAAAMSSILMYLWMERVAFAKSADEP
jgi:hypothetical protein